MAKRDKLYTVNKWNKPFFEEERKRKLYPRGGLLNIIPGLNEGQASKVWGYADTGGIDYTAPISSLARQNSIDKGITSFSDYSNPGYYQNLIRTHIAPETTTGGGTSKKNSDASNMLSGFDLSGAIDTAKRVVNEVKGATAVPAASSLIAPSPKIPDRAKDILKNIVQPSTQITKSVTAPKLALNTIASTEPTAKAYLGNIVSPEMKAAVGLSSKQLVSNLPSYKPSGSSISGLGKMGINLGASVLGEVGKGLISNGFNTVPGQVIDTIGNVAGTVLPFIPGVGWAAAPIVIGASKLLSGAANAAFGTQTFDNGATAYTNRLNSLNINGSNEYLANLLSYIGAGPRATYRDGWFRDKGKNESAAINDAQDLALTRTQRGIRDSFANNNWNQLQYALNDYSTYGAMGGKLNRKKCNCKSYGGYLDSATPTGFNFLSDLTNIQMLKNQTDQDMNSSIGNSFMSTPDMGSILANGGPINIKKSHRGRLTELKKRTGKTEAELYNDGNPAHKKMVVFARNARRWKKAYGGFLDAANSLADAEDKLYGNGKNKNTRQYSFIPGASLYELGGTLQAAGSNWGNVSEINEGGSHEENPYEGVLVGVDPEGTPNLVEEGEVIWNDYVFSNRIECPKEVCKALRVGVKKDGFTFAEVSKRLLKESKERPNDPISKRGLEANMQKLEDAQEEVKQKMEAEQAVEQFNSLPPEQQVAIMNQEGEKALDAVALELMAQEFNNLPPEQQQAIAQQMAMEQALAQSMPQGQPSPELQAMIRQQMAQQQMPQSNINPQEVLAQTAAMLQAGLNGAAFGGKLYALGGDEDVNNLTGPVGRKSKSHWERDARGNKVLVPNSKYGWEGFGGGSFGSAGGGASWGEDPAPLMPRKRDWLAIDYKESFNKAYKRARKEKKKTFWFDGKEYSTAYNPNLTKEEVEAGNNRYQTKGLLIAPWEHACGGRLFAEGGMIPQDESMAAEEQYQQGGQSTEQVTEQTDSEMAKYSDEELQDMIEDYQEAESGEVKVTKGKLARLRKKAEKAQAELERRHAEENEEQPLEARQEPSQEEVLAAAQAQAVQTLQPIEGQPQEGTLQEGVSPEQAMMMQQQMEGQLMSPELMAAMELQQLGNGQYAYGGKLYLTGGLLLQKLGYKTTKNVPFKLDDLGITRWEQEIPDLEASWNNIASKIKDPIIAHAIALGWTPYADSHSTVKNWYEDKEGRASSWTNAGKWKTNGYTWDELTNPTTGLVNYLPHLKWAIDNGKLVKPESGNITVEQMKHAFDGNPDWEATNQYLFNDKDALAHLLEYLARRRGMKDFDDEKFLNKWNQYGTFELDSDGNWKYKLKQNQDPAKFTEAFRNSRFDGLLGTMLDVFLNANPAAINYIVDEKGNPTDEQIIGNPNLDEYELVRPAYNFYQAGPNGEKFNPGTNYTIGYYKRKGTTGASSSDIANDEEGNYLTVGWKPKTNWTDYTLGMLPGLTGLGMMFAQGKPDTSSLEAAANAYAANMGVQAPVHLTHGLMKPAIIDPRVTHNTLTASKLGTNRLLRNTGSAPSQAASILANDTNYQHQMGSNDLRDWLANREQEQKSATFNEGVARANAQFLNQGDQFNAQMLANAGEKYAQARYNLEKEKLDQENAWRAGILGNVGSAMTGLYNAYREGQNRNERDLLAASEVFGETNGLLDEYYGINKVDPKTGLIKRGPDAGKYWYDGSAHNQPQLAISAKGGKLKRKNKRKGFTF